ncbi:MAG: o-succinylbenzoate--CoA ligase, partial [Micrococcales bacterium]
MIDPLAADDPPAVVLAAAACGESLMLRTSATSGVSRALRRTAASWVDSFPAVAARLDLRAGDTVWIPGPLAATMNLFAACLAHWAGASWSAHPQRCRFIQTTPTGLRRLVPRTAMSGATVVVAGDRLPARDRDIARAAGLRVQHYYGAAELSLVAWGSCEEDLRLFDDVEADVRDGQLWVRSPWLSSGPVP